MKHILLAVDDSPAGLAAARAAITLAAQTSAQLRAIQVLANGEVARELHERSETARTEERRERGSTAVLKYVTGLAERAGVDIECMSLWGQPARVILNQATSWAADVIVLGRAGHRHVGQPYIGSDVRHVLEFTTVPVLVVPHSGQAEHH
jgi:nucleotide-binding universal stress UspA family protein